MRSYQHQCIGSYQNSAVKPALARLVLGWMTSRKVLVLHPSFFLVFLFFFVKNVWLYNFKTVRPNLTCDTFSESPKRALRWMMKENGVLLLFFFLLQILILMYFFVHFVISAILRGENYMFWRCFRIFCMYQSSYKQDRVFLHSWWDPRQIDHKVVKKEYIRLHSI